MFPLAPPIYVSAKYAGASPDDPPTSDKRGAYNTEIGVQYINETPRAKERLGDIQLLFWLGNDKNKSGSLIAEAYLTREKAYSLIDAILDKLGELTDAETQPNKQA